jgi:hypothetical protein
VSVLIRSRSRCEPPFAAKPQSGAE